MIDIQIFGPLAVRAGSRSIGPRDFGGVKPKQVLEILLAARRRPVPKDRLADLLWGERLPRHVCAALETYVSVLRRRLSALDPGAGSLVVTEPGAYRLAAGCSTLDLDRFDNLLEQAGRAPAGEARQHLEGALRLVRGEVLADEPYVDWATGLRAEYADLHHEALLDAARLAMADRDLSTALTHARHVVDVNPTCERGHRAVMLVQYTLGNRGGAIRAFERCRLHLSEELCVEPSDATRALYGAIVRQDDPDTLLPAPVWAPTVPATLASAPDDAPGLAEPPFAGRNRQLAMACAGLLAVDGAEKWPAALRDLVLARARDAGTEGYQILLTASIFGRPFSAESLAALLDTCPVELSRELERLCERRLLRVEGNRYAFLYEVVEEVLCDTLSPAHRQLLTRRLRPSSRERVHPLAQFVERGVRDTIAAAI